MRVKRAGIERDTTSQQGRMRNDIGGYVNAASPSSKVIICDFRQTAFLLRVLFCYVLTDDGDDGGQRSQ